MFQLMWLGSTYFMYFPVEKSFLPPVEPGDKSVELAFKTFSR